MQQPTPLLSVVVPTYNRAHCALPGVRSLLAMESRLLQVVVCDNSDNQELEDGLRPHRGDARLLYQRAPGRLTVSENFEQACRFATGEYIGVIGDDDGVNPALLDVARWALDRDLDAVAGPVLADYGWPDFLRRYYGAASAAVLRVKAFSGEISFPSVPDELRKCLCAGGQDFARLPRIYYGIVRRRCLDEVRQRWGACFPGVSPDMAGAIALSAVVRTACWVDYPLFLPGSSRKSGAGQSAMKRHLGRMEDQVHMGGDRQPNWPALVPRFYSVQTVWAASTLTALYATGRRDLDRELNVARLHAMCAVFNPCYASFVVRHFQSLRRIGAPHASLPAFVGHYLRTWGTRVESLASRTLGKVVGRRVRLFSGVQDIGAAVDRLQAEVRGETGTLLARLANEGRST